jgi:hypothetical protein
MGAKSRFLVKLTFLAVGLSCGLLGTSRAWADTDITSSAYGAISSLLGGTSELYAGETSLPIITLSMGGLSEGLGQAISAYPVDGAAFVINPAASSMLVNSETSLTHNAWISDTKVETALYTTRFGDLGIGVAGKLAYNDFAEQSDYTKVAKGYYTESMGVLNVSYNFLSGYHFGGLAAGVNLKAAYRSVPDYTDNEGNIIAGSGADQSAIGIMADFGLLTRFNFLKFYPSRDKNFAVALVARNLGPAVLEEPLPTQFSLGASYTFLKPLTVAIDVAKQVNLVDPAASAGFIYCLGFNAQLFDFFALDAGCMLKNGNLRLSAAAQVDLAEITVVANYTLDLITQFQNANRLSIEFKLALGDGGRAAYNQKVEEFYRRGVDAYAQGNTEAAIEFWE